MEKYFDRDEVRMVFVIDDETKLLKNISIEIKDVEFFPKTGIDEISLKPEISGWLEALQQTIFGFMRQTPRIIKKKPLPEYGENVEFDPGIQPEELRTRKNHMEKYIDNLNTNNNLETGPIVIKCLKCGNDVTLMRGCCGAGGKNIYRGECNVCGKQTNLPANVVERK